LIAGGSVLGAMIPSLDIVIVNWNTGPQLAACLRSIGAASREGFHLARVIVVDNGSNDRSAEGLGVEGVPLEVVFNGENRGFAAACNQGAARSMADYLLFLNPDTELFGDSLAVPIAFLERPDAASIGICGVRLVDASGRPVVSCARFPTLSILASEALGLPRLWPGRFPPHLIPPDECRSTREVDQVIGAFFLVRRRLFETLGGFDERFFVYFEEVDLSLRARRLGFRSVCLAEARACHHGGLSSRQVRARRLFYSLRSRLQYGFKHYRPLAAWSLVFVTLGIEPFTRIAAAILGGAWRQAADTAGGYAMLAAEGWRMVAGRPFRVGGRGGSGAPARVGGRNERNE
jgi:GT2 family glycosyltransferase